MSSLLGISSSVQATFTWPRAVCQDVDSNSTKRAFITRRPAPSTAALCANPMKAKMPRPSRVRTETGKNTARTRKDKGRTTRRRETKKSLTKTNHYMPPLCCSMKRTAGQLHTSTSVLYQRQGIMEWLHVTHVSHGPVLPRNTNHCVGGRNPQQMLAWRVHKPNDKPNLPPTLITQRPPPAKEKNTLSRAKTAAVLPLSIPVKLYSCKRQTDMANDSQSQPSNQVKTTD